MKTEKEKLEEENQKIAAEKKVSEEKVSALTEQIKILTETVNQEKLLKQSDDKKAAEERETKIAEEKAAEADIKKLLSMDKSGDDDKELTSSEILDVVANAFDTAMDSKLSSQNAVLVESMKPLAEKIDSVQKFILNREAAAGVQAARDEFPDFDKHKEAVGAVLQKYPGIDIKDAYILATGNKAMNVPARKETDSERPITLATRSSLAAKRHEEKIETPDRTSSSRRNIKDILSAAAEKVLSERNA